MRTGVRFVRVSITNLTFVDTEGRGAAFFFVASSIMNCTKEAVIYQGR